jgi:hypothetical protein
VTGDIAWTCVGPALPELPIYPVTAVLLSAPASASPPLTLFQHHGQAYVRCGAALIGVFPAWRTFGRPAATLTPAEYDPRLLRPLPWKPHDFEQQEFPTLLSWGAFYGIALAAIPVFFVGWTVRRRQWGMKTMLFAPVVVGLAMLAILISPEDRDFHSPWNKLIVAYFAAGPVIFALATLGLWLRQGRWRRVATWICVALAAGVAVMAVSLAFVEPDSASALQPGERYTWDGWYYMYLPVLYLMSWLLLIVVTGTWLLRTAWSWWNGRGPRKRTHRAAG